MCLASLTRSTTNHTVLCTNTPPKSRFPSHSKRKRRADGFRVLPCHPRAPSFPNFLTIPMANGHTVHKKDEETHGIPSCTTPPHHSMSQKNTPVRPGVSKPFHSVASAAVFLSIHIVLICLFIYMYVCQKQQQVKKASETSSKTRPCNRSPVNGTQLMVSKSIPSIYPAIHVSLIPTSSRQRNKAPIKRTPRAAGRLQEAQTRPSLLLLTNGRSALLVFPNKTKKGKGRYRKPAMCKPRLVHGL